MLLIPCTKLSCLCDFAEKLYCSCRCFNGYAGDAQKETAHSEKVSGQKGGGRRFSANGRHDATSRQLHRLIPSRGRSKDQFKLMLIRPAEELLPLGVQVTSPFGLRQSIAHWMEVHPRHPVPYGGLRLAWGNLVWVFAAGILTLI
jgi:hypothetical protein